MAIMIVQGFKGHKYEFCATGTRCQVRYMMYCLKPVAPELGTVALAASGMEHVLAENFIPQWEVYSQMAVAAVGERQ